MQNQSALKNFLDEKAELYNQPAFIKDDPVSIPHAFSKPQDIEIAGFFAAVLGWGRRNNIIRSCGRLMEFMDHAPHDFICNHQPEDLKKILGFAHRTFNDTDLLYFLSVLQKHYTHSSSLETAFTGEGTYTEPTVEAALRQFHNYFFSGEFPERTRKHISTPARGSACKRLCMYLRWMVRKDDGGVDFGIWNRISAAQLICPLDVHVARVANRLGLMENEKSNWRNAEALTDILRQWRPEDPVYYDYALFGLGVNE
jgi:uncharacterized protein (TIGR02757 family)